MTTGASVARGLALLVAALFAAAPFVIWFWVLLPGDDELTWGRVLLAFAYLSGAALLAVGANFWYGKKAGLLRVGGFVVLLAGALVTVSFAFALVPILLLAVPSLLKREHAPPAVNHGGCTSVAGQRS